MAWARWLRVKMDRVTAGKRNPVFDLNEMGIALMRMNLRRRHPDASEAEIHAMLVDWVRDRPGAPNGDAAGVASKRFM